MSWSIRGNFVHATEHPFRATASSPALDASPHVRWLGPGLCLLIDHVLTVNPEGCITRLETFVDHSARNEPQDHARILIELQDNEFLCPGMIDLHIHAPQFAYTGTATDRPLTGPDGWLETYAFPAERRLAKDLDQARRVYSSLVETTLRHGTTTAVYFGTLDLQPSQVLVDAAMEKGQRALVGKVCMDRNAPADYCQSTQQNLQETVALMEYIYKTAGKKSPGAKLPLVLPLITPRFIPTCTPKLLTALGDLARRENCHITSHISESLDEVAWSRQLDQQDHPSSVATENGGRTDAVIFNEHGLLTDQCIMAHGVWLNNDDCRLLRERGSAIAHCPLSNFFFANGSAACREWMQNGNKVGLGSDVAGGYHLSLLDSSRMAVVASRALEHQKQQPRPKQPQQGSSVDADRDKQEENGTNCALDYRHAFYLATLGGAEALNLHDRIGNFAGGKELDAVVFSASNNIFCNDTDRLEDVFQKICNLGDDRNVVRVFVGGRQVV